MPNQKIFLYGGKSTAFLVQEILKEKKKKVSYIFDKYIEKQPHFKTLAQFSNKKEDLLYFLKNSKFFFVCIGMMDGKLRCSISKKLKEHKIKEISIKSKESCLDRSVEYGSGLLAMPHCVVNKKTIIGSNCYLNVNSVIDHECKIGDGVHIMGAAYIAGRVTVGNFASIGANATILPDISIGENSIIGAGAVVTKDVPSNSVVVGNPARFLRKNNKKYDFSI